MNAKEAAARICLLEMPPDSGAGVRQRVIESIIAEALAAKEAEIARLEARTEQLYVAVLRSVDILGAVPEGKCECDSCQVGRLLSAALLPPDEKVKP